MADEKSGGDVLKRRFDIVNDRDNVAESQQGTSRPADIRFRLVPSPRLVASPTQASPRISRDRFVSARVTCRLCPRPAS